jgi:hypothetical protein
MIHPSFRSRAGKFVRTVVGSACAPSRVLPTFAADRSGVIKVLLRRARRPSRRHAGCFSMVLAAGFNPGPGIPPVPAITLTAKLV